MPHSVSSRVDSRSLRTSTISRSRPTNVVNCCGRLFGVDLERAQSRELVPQFGRNHLPNPLRVRTGRAAARCRGREGTCLLGSRSRTRSATAWEISIWPPWAALMMRAARLTLVPKEIVVASFIDASVQSAADEELNAAGRRWIGKSPLQLDHCRDAVRRVAEHRVQPVTGRFDDRALVILDGLAGQLIMAGQRQPHSLGFALPQPGAALDVGEEKGRDGGFGVHALALRWHGATTLRECRTFQQITGGSRRAGSHDFFGPLQASATASATTRPRKQQCSINWQV